MATVSQIICDLCGDTEETGGGHIPSIRSICFAAGPRNAPTDDVHLAPDLCADCRTKTVGAILRMLKRET